MRWKVKCPYCDEDGYVTGSCSCMDDTCCCAEPDELVCGECKGKGYVIVSELTDDNCEDAIPVMLERGERA